MKVTAATLLTLLAAAPSAYAANTRRLGAADVSDIDNRRLSMDLIETAAVEPADYYYYEGGESKSGKSKGTDKSKGTNKSKGTDKSKGSAKSDKGDYYYYEGGESKSDKSKGSAKSDKSKGSAKSGKEASAKLSSSMMAATADGPPPEAAALIAKIIEVLGELGVDMPEQASGVEPAVFNGPIIDAIIEAILDALFGYGGSKSGKGSKSGDHDYYYYEGDSKSGKGESKSAKGVGLTLTEQASGVEPAFDGPIVSIIEAIIEEILEALFGYGSKSGKGSKSGDHDYYYYEGDSKSGKGESKSGKGESKSVKGA